MAGRHQDGGTRCAHTMLRKALWSLRKSFSPSALMGVMSPSRSTWSSKPSSSMEYTYSARASQSW